MADLSLAWQRVKDDIKESRVFITAPYEVELVELDLKSWLDRILSEIKNRTYNPASAEIIDSPKPNYGIRPGSHLRLEDRVVYAALVGSFFDKLKERLSWSTQIDYSH